MAQNFNPKVINIQKGPEPPIGPLIYSSLNLVAQQLKTLDPYDYYGKFSEVSLKCLFLATIMTKLQKPKFKEKYIIKSEHNVSPSGPAKYADLTIESLETGDIFIIEFKYTTLTYIKDLRIDKPGLGQNIFLDGKFISPDEEKRRENGAYTRKLVSDVIESWNTNWVSAEEIFKSNPFSANSPLSIYGIHDFSSPPTTTASPTSPTRSGSKPPIPLSALVLSDLKGDQQQQGTKDDVQLLTYTLNSLSLNPKRTGRTIPILIRGIINKLFYSSYKYTVVSGQMTSAEKEYHYVI